MLTILLIALLSQPATASETTGGTSTRESPAPAAAAPAAPQAAPAAFPSAWTGHWRGAARVVTPERPPLEFTMELIIGPTEDPARWNWTIVYDGAAGRQERKYQLLVIDAAKGQYAIDEQQGIVLQAQLLEGTLHSFFVVQGVQLSTSERLVNAGTPDEAILVEMVTSRVDRFETSGGKDGVPEVKSHRPQSVQLSRLTRVPAPAPADPPGSPSAPTKR
jgi:hypothetical protein